MPTCAAWLLHDNDDHAASSVNEVLPGAFASLQLSIWQQTPAHSSEPCELLRELNGSASMLGGISQRLESALLLLVEHRTKHGLELRLLHASEKPGFFRPPMFVLGSHKLICGASVVFEVFLECLDSEKEAQTNARKVSEQLTPIVPWLLVTPLALAQDSGK